MKRVAAILVCALCLMVSAQAKADAVVQVKVRSANNQPVDGRVELSGDGGTFTCTTSQGTCTIRSVPGGRYLAVFKPKTGSATAPKKVMIPPDGKADLHIAAK
ncbi:MAG: carboxypeptidase regulatory-like domain-containing protein [Myxococcales bacterium]|jgi:hypothetical protein|nr:MAG: carboxypeptidase regulatory-like domain-containing protein [Myxococcales bacterium]